MQLRYTTYQKKRTTPIIATNVATQEETHFSSQAEAADCLMCVQGNINKVLQGKLRTTKGYTFRYANNDSE